MGLRNRLWKNRDMSAALLLVVAALLLAAKLVLADAQRVYINIQAPLDDTLMLNAAESVAAGDWLGEYNYLTLSKHSFFTLWLAFLNKLGIPYLLGGQLLWAAASAAAAGALFPFFKKRWGSLCLFAALLFSPSSTANSEPNGFITRVYRDNIFPALCLLCIAGVIGYALRHKNKLKSNWGWLALCGASLCACYLCREDGWWLLPFIVVAFAVVAVFMLRGGAAKLRQRLFRCVAMLLPFVICAVGVLSWCGANNSYYGRFIVSDFSSGEFAAAYGAMTRIEHENWNPKIAVPRDVRIKLYALVPEFAALENELERGAPYGRYASRELGDYSSGMFYWALRDAAQINGYYESAETARQYFATLAQKINALCDSGELSASAARSSVNPPLRAEYIGPVLAEAGYSLWFCASFQQCDARSMWTPTSDDPAQYQILVPHQEFLNEQVQWKVYPGTVDPVYTQWDEFCFGAFDAIRAVYSAALPLALLAALFWQLREGFLLNRLRRQKKRDAARSLEWIVLLGLWLLIALRALMVAYVQVSSFTIGTYVMYLATIHPLMLMAGFAGCWRLAGDLRRRNQ